MRAIKKYIGIICLLLGFHSLFAQQVYPVKLSGLLIPPHSMELSDYATQRSQNLMFTATLNDPVEISRDVYFKLTVKNNNREILVSDPNRNTLPTQLLQFTPELLTGFELATYLDPANLVSPGGGQASNLLPEGFNQICLEVIDAQRGVPISRQACVSGFFELFAPPLLELPQPDAVIGGTRTPDLMFHWLPRHLGQLNAPGMVEYEFNLVELLPGIGDPNDGFDFGISVYQTTVMTSSLLFLEIEPFLEPGKTYAWRVQAKDPMGSNVFKNNGYSMVSTFYYEDIHAYYYSEHSKEEYALDFDGKDDHLILDNTAGLLRNSFTIEFWAKRNSVNDNDFIILQSYQTIEDNKLLHIGFSKDNTFLFGFWGDNYCTSPIYEDTGWHHWACTFDAGSMDQKIYRDGKLLGTHLSKSKLLSSFGLIVGSGKYPWEDWAFNGLVDGLRIWDVARSEMEIRKTMNVSLIENELGLQVQYTFDDGPGSGIAQDLKSRGGASLQLMDINNDWIPLEFPPVVRSEKIAKTTPESVVEIRPGPYALDFDGKNDYVDLGAIDLSNTSFSVEFWAKRTSLGTEDIAVGQYGLTSVQNFFIGFLPDNTFTFSLGEESLNISQVFADADWHHWTCVFDASDRTQTIFKDGVKILSRVAKNTYQGSGKVLLGAKAPDSEGYFHGMLEEVRVWKRPLNPREIAANKDRYFQGNERGLLRYYRFNDGLGSKAVKDIAAKKNGLLKNMDANSDWVSSNIPTGGEAIDIPTIEEPKGNFALHFDGADDFVSLGAPLLPIRSAFSPVTIEAWVKTNDTYGAIIAQYGSDTDRFMLLLDQNKLGYWKGGKMLALSTTTINDGKWHHIAVVKEVSGSLQLYIDGVPDGQGVDYNAFIPTNTLIGTVLDNIGKPERTLSLVIDEVRIWEVARSWQEINANKDKTLHSNEFGLVNYYKFNEGSGSEKVQDYMGGSDGALINMEIDLDWVLSPVEAGSSEGMMEVAPSNLSDPATDPVLTTTSSVNTVLDFDGVDDYVDLLEPGMFPTSSRMPFTVEILVKTRDDDGAIISDYDFNSDDRFVLYVMEGKLKYWKDGNVLAASTSNINDGQWHHLAATKDEDGNIKLYVDGKEDGTGIDNSAFPGKGVLLGAFLYSGKPERVFSGRIDEVRIWKTTRTAQQIDSKKDQSLQGMEYGLVHYYKLNDGKGSLRTRDEAGKAHGMLYNMDSSSAWMEKD